MCVCVCVCVCVCMCVSVCLSVRMCGHVISSLQQFVKQWVVLSSHLPGEASLHFYTSKSAVLHDPAVNMERLSDMNDVCHLGYSKKQLILQLSYTDHTILLLFSSASTMKLWQEKLKAFLC